MTGTPVPQRHAEVRRPSGQARMPVLPTEMETRVASENRPEVEKELEPRQPGQCPAEAIERARHTNRRWRRQWHATRAAQRTRYKKQRGIDLICHVHAHWADRRAVAEAETDGVREIVQIRRRRRSGAQGDPVHILEHIS